MTGRDEELKRVGERLRDLRRVAGETQAQTATEVGISRQYLSEVEAGANPTVDLMYRLAEHFRVPPASLLDGFDATDRR
ncbi:helix-turn-helix domain-containing protein [Gordonia sputi]